MGATLQEHQAALIPMLREIDRICRKYDISYQLFAGTALGAVRHGGFIPWDDDLDIVMLRPEYERFLEAAPAELDPEIYYLQKEFSDHWPMFFSKLRKNGTACLERYIPKDPESHRGIYIDIFPCDNLSDNAVLAKCQFYMSKFVIARSLDRRGYLTDSGAKKLVMLCSKVLPVKPMLRFVQMRGNRETKMVHTFFGASSRYEKSIYPREWFTSSVAKPFEGGDYPVSGDYDALLTRLYGDYMTLPPEEDRGCKVHAELVDLERSYTEYEGVQQTMEFKEYSRSIR